MLSRQRNGRPRSSAGSSEDDGSETGGGLNLGVLRQMKKGHHTAEDLH